MKTAIIDLGTNTCNLLIANYTATDFKLLHQSKQLVKLGDIKIRDNLISDEAIARVLAALEEQQKIIDSMGVDEVRIITTSAVREANNKEAFLQAVSKKMNCPVEAVTGDKEAELIFKGVLLAMNNLEEKSMILDIGGGSNEIILAHNREMFWKESQPTGMARIINQFVLSDPLKQREIQILQNFFSARHQAAIQQCKNNAVNTLIGCSGSFDTIADIIDQTEPGKIQRQQKEIPLKEFHRVHTMLVNSTHKQRLEIKGMDNVRVDLIVPAIVLIEQLIKQAGITRIIQTDFALREGVLFDLMNSEEKMSGKQNLLSK